MKKACPRLIDTAYIIVKRDITAHYRGLSWIFMLFLTFLTWIFFTTTTLANLMKIGNYFQYLVAGIIVLGIYNGSYNYMNVVVGERRRGYTKYLLSLPINRMGLALGRVCAGMLQGVTFSFFSLVITFLLVGLPSVGGLGVMIATIMCVSFGWAGLGISIAIYLRSGLIDAASDGIGLWLMFCSSVFIPLYIAPDAFRPIVVFNPMSAAAKRSSLVNSKSLLVMIACQKRLAYEYRRTSR